LADVAYVLERILMFFAYVLDIIIIFADTKTSNYVRKRTYNATEAMA
jgi:hypothetical protein